MNIKKLLALIGLFSIGLFMIVLISFSAFFLESEGTPTSYTDASKIVGGIIGDESDPYAMGENYLGRYVYVNPDRAFEQMLEDYKDGFKAIKKKYHIMTSISKQNWSLYGVYGWQLDGSFDENICEQGREISRRLDFYENSFE